MDFYVVFTLQMMIVCSQGVLCYWFRFLCGSSRENVAKFWRGDMSCRHGKHFCHFVPVTFLYCPSFHKRPSAQVQREVESANQWIIAAKHQSASRDAPWELKNDVVAGGGK